MPAELKSSRELTPSRELDAASVARAKAVAALPRGAHIHVSGACGTGMASVLQLLKALGYHVTGSDKAFYPPMGDVVRKVADKVYEGYSEKNLVPHPALVVIGNSLSRGNPEVEYVLEQSLPFASMPEVFSALLIGDREHCPMSIVVTGTHGKTTTTAAVAKLFDSAGRKPGYFIGGVPKNLPGSIRAVDTSVPTEQRVVALEGDEYDSAFFAKYSKFHSYRPDIAIITSIEFDHADIYSSLAEIEIEFTRLVARVPKSGAILAADDSETLDRLIPAWAPSIQAPVYRYGSKPSSAFRLLSRTPLGGAGQELALSLRGAELTARTSLSGPHNALNLLAAAAAGSLNGLSLDEIARGVSAFEGVLRRQHVVLDRDGITVLEDFAHHPTAVETTLRGLRELYPARRIVAVFEPRSNTSRRGFFQEAYAKSFDSADSVIIQNIVDSGGYWGTSEKREALSVPRLVSEIGQRGPHAVCFETVPEILDYLGTETKPGDVIVLMSNGDFGGLPKSLPERLAAR